ncbi:MAG: hypothetical protein M3O22_03630 [Pseudomonadota bacterium]|nr:hypothetical protein [Pseudomonadota bacterium]
MRFLNSPPLIIKPDNNFPEVVKAAFQDPEKNLPAPRPLPVFLINDARMITMPLDQMDRAMFERVLDHLSQSPVTPATPRPRSS